MTTYSERLKKAMAHAKITQPALAEKAGVSQQNIQHLASKGKGSSHTTAIAKALGVNPEWLQTGAGEMMARTHTDIGERSAEYGIKKVPLISSVQAGDFCESIDNYAPGDAEDWILCPTNHSDKAYALKIEGTSMKPRFLPGEIIVVDPERAALPGKFVVAKRDGDKKTTFKQLMADGDQHYLQALNPDWPNPIILMTEEWHICGVLICKVEIF